MKRFIQKKSYLLLLYLFISGSCIASEEVMSFTYSKSGTLGIIDAAGIIDELAASRLQKLVVEKQLPAHTVVSLNSPGGSVAGGIKLGKAIRQLKFDTNVRYKRDCLSACVFAYVGGVNRWLSESSRLGIHQFYKADSKSGSMSEGQVVSGLIAAYLEQMNVKPTFLTAMSFFDRSEIHYLTREEAVAFGVVNDGVQVKSPIYRMDNGRPYLMITAKDRQASSSIALMCSGGSIYLVAQRNPYDVNDFFEAPLSSVRYIWVDEDPIFQFDLYKKTFTKQLTTEELRKLFLSRSIRVGGSKEYADIEATKFVVDDWSPFRDFSIGCLSHELN